MSAREALKKRSAQLGYSLGYGTKRHFATYDIVEKTPAFFGVLSFAIGITFLIYKNDSLATFIGASSSVVGFALLYLNEYLNEKDKYITTGKQLNILYSKAYSIYEKSKTCQDNEIHNLESELDKINDEFQKISIHKQVFFSNEYAHFKLFGESQPDWFVNELGLSFWKDKIPAIWRIYGAIIFTALFIWVLFKYSTILNLNEFLSVC